MADVAVSPSPSSSSAFPSTSAFASAAVVVGSGLAELDGAKLTPFSLVAAVEKTLAAMTPPAAAAVAPVVALRPDALWCCETHVSTSDITESWNKVTASKSTSLLSLSLSLSLSLASATSSSSRGSHSPNKVVSLMSCCSGRCCRCCRSSCWREQRPRRRTEYECRPATSC